MQKADVCWESRVRIWMLRVQNSICRFRCIPTLSTMMRSPTLMSELATFTGPRRDIFLYFCELTSRSRMNRRKSSTASRIIVTQRTKSWDERSNTAWRFAKLTSVIVLPEGAVVGKLGAQCRDWGSNLDKAEKFHWRYPFHQRPTECSYDDFTDRALSVGRWDCEGQDTEPALVCRG